jgi:serine/threonine-protein kinase HipA
MFNWLIGGTDAHAKNYSLLIGAGDEIRFAPLYDLSSQLSYPDLIEQRVAMKIGDHYDIRRVGIADWRKLARACTIEEERVLTLLRSMAKALPDAISAARKQALIEGLSEKFIAPLAQQLIKHVGERLAAITAVTSSRRSASVKTRRGGPSA